MHEDEDWEAYYRAQTGRPVRPAFAEALARLAPLEPGTAVDLGAGDGTETRALLAAGWRVQAVDATPGLRGRVLGPGRDRGPDHDERLTTVEATFAELTELPPAELVYAGMSLPFCSRAELEHVLALVADALLADGLFVAHLLGERDDWRHRPGVTTLTGAELASALSRFEVLDQVETERDGPSGTGPKHWHTHLVTARRGPGPH